MKQDQPFGLLPTLNIPGPNGEGKILLCETSAILGYLEDALCIAPAHQNRNALERTKLDIIKEASLNFMSNVHDFLWAKNWDEKEKYLGFKGFCNQWLNNLTNQFEKLKPTLIYGPQTDDNKTTTLTAASAALFEALELIETLYPGTVKDHEEVHKMHQALLARPRISSYIRNKKRFAQITLSPEESPERLEKARKNN